MCVITTISVKISVHYVQQEAISIVRCGCVDSYNEHTFFSPMPKNWHACPKRTVTSLRTMNNVFDV